MPRETVDFREFTGGVNYAADPKDLPLNASPVEANAEPSSVSVGNLRGCLTTTDIITAAETPSLPDIGWARGVGFLPRANGTWDMIYRENKNKKVYSVQDIETTRKYVELGSLPDPSTNYLLDTPAFVEDGVALRIGRGPYANHDTKWVGYLTGNIFGSATPLTAVMSDDKCETLGSLPFFDKVCNDGTYLYGIEYNGTRIYKMQLSDASLNDVTVLGQIEGVRSICTGPTGYVLALVLKAGIYEVHIITTSTMDTSAIKTVTGVAFGWSDLELTDIAYTSGGGSFGDWWLASFSKDPNGADVVGTTWGGVTEDVIWRATPADLSAGNLAFTDVTPNITANKSTTLYSAGATNGYYYYYNPTTKLSDLGVTVSTIEKMHRHSLVTLNSTTIGLSFQPLRFFFGDEVYGAFYKASSGSNNGWKLIAGNYCLLVVDNNDSKGAASRVINVANVSTTNFSQLGYYSHATDGILLQTRGRQLAKRDLDSGQIPTTAGDYVELSTTTSLLSKYALGAITINGTDVYASRSSVNLYPGEYSRQGVSKTNTTMASWTNDDWLNGGLLTITCAATSRPVFIKNKQYHYKVCFEYDGFQYSPLTAVLAVYDSSTNGYSCNLTVNVLDMSALNRRVTAILVFKAYGGTAHGELDTQYRLVKKLSLLTGIWKVSGSTAEAVFEDAISDSGVIFEALSGFPETLDHTWVNWGSGVVLNNYLFVGNCYTPDIIDSQTYVFRSKPYRYSTFDWSTDYVKLPEPIVGIGQYAGRIYACTYDRCYIINPASLQVEEVVEGMGTMWHYGITTTAEGIFIAGEKHIFHSNGRQHVIISAPIETIIYPFGAVYPSEDRLPYGKVSFSGWGSSVLPLLLYEPIYDCLMVIPITNYVSTYVATWHLYHPETKSWWFFSDTRATGMYAPYWASSFGTYVMFSHLGYNSPNPPVQCLISVYTNTTRAPWYWVLPEIGDGMHYFKYYQCGVDGSGFAAPVFMKDHDIGGWSSHTTVETGVYRPSTKQRGKSFLIKLSGTTTSYITNADAVIRKMLGVRK